MKDEVLRVTQGVSDVAVRAGGSALLECYIVGPPDVDVDWLSNGKLIQPALLNCKMHFDGKRFIHSHFFSIILISSWLNCHVLDLFQFFLFYVQLGHTVTLSAWQTLKNRQLLQWFNVCVYIL